jgi:glycosyltransferase involved in cell wall biosynthesis
MADLSILIPARNEMFLAKTIENILSNIEGDTEVLVVLDGAWADPGVPDDNRVTLLYNPQSVGQRAATNQAARLSKAKYVMKCDAHCSFDKGFDIKMMQETHDDWTMTPLMRNLHAFDWVCPDGHRRYQGPSGPCSQCGKETVRDVVWIAKERPKSTSYCFDAAPHFQYFGEYTKRPEGMGDITETMSLQGSCWMLTRDKYWELGICDENFGSWGSQGIEVAVKTWLSGGRVMVNKKTWYAHMFRTQGGDFGFPYPISGKDQEKAKDFARDLFFNNKWDKQIRPLSWLIEKFWPVKGWTEEDLKKLKTDTFKFSTGTNAKPAESEPTEELSDKGIIYSSSDACKESPCKGIIFYTDNRLKLKIARTVQRQLKEISKAKGIPIVSASLKPMPHFGKNIHFPHLKSGYLAYFTQILAALENSTADIIFFCEHDVLYPPSHFDFTPPKKDIFYYNHNWWRVRTTDGFTAHWDANQVSGLCGYREHLLKFYRERLLEIKKSGYNHKMGFEPGGRNGVLTRAWKSDIPYIDLKHGGNLSKNKWSLKDFRDKSTAKNFVTGNEIPGWGPALDLIKRFN